jgi:hypothetical protein
MAKPNYRFDKRQREIKKKQKQEEKRLKKQAAMETPPPEGAAVNPDNHEPGETP